MYLSTGRATWWLVAPPIVWARNRLCDQSRPVRTSGTTLQLMVGLVLRHPRRQNCNGCWIRKTQKIRAYISSTADAGIAKAGCCGHSPTSSKEKTAKREKNIIPRQLWNLDAKPAERIKSWLHRLRVWSWQSHYDIWLLVTATTLCRIHSGSPTTSKKYVLW